MYETEAHLDSAAIIKRLKRIEGQVRGIAGMLEEHRNCVDIMTQLSAVNAAVTNTAREILYSHIAYCVKEGFETGDAGTTVENLRRSVESFGKLK